MIREIVECGLERDVYLFYGNKNLNDAMFHDELSALSDRFENINYLPVIEDPSEGYQGLSGLITGDLIKIQLGIRVQRPFTFAGPRGCTISVCPNWKDLAFRKRR